MNPAAFDYHRVDRVEDALERLAELGEDAKMIAGGQSLECRTSAGRVRRRRPRHPTVNATGFPDGSCTRAPPGSVCGSTPASRSRATAESSAPSSGSTIVICRSVAVPAGACVAPALSHAFAPM